MSRRINGYGVITKNALISTVNLNRLHKERTILLGTVVKIQEDFKNDYVSVRLLKDDNETWEDESFYCDKSLIAPVSEEIWPYLAWVVSPQERVKLAKKPDLCDALAKTTKNSQVVFTDIDDIYVGVVKFKGSIKGFGKGFGILLHEKKPRNNCNGSCAGIQYFQCEPGYGLFTTIEKIKPYRFYTADAKENSEITYKSDLDTFTEKNVEPITVNSQNNGIYNKQRQKPESVNHNRNSTLDEKISNNIQSFKTSISLQNIYAPISNTTLNPNHDFDQNSIIQPEKTKLLQVEGQKQNKNFAEPKHRSEINLMEAITKKIPSIDSIESKKILNNNHSYLEYERSNQEYMTNTSKQIRNKSSNLMSHLVGGSRTLPRKSKYIDENGKESRSTFYLPYEENNANYKDDIYNQIPLTVLELNRTNESSLHSERTNNEVASTSNRQDPSNLYQPLNPGTTGDLSIGSLVEIANDVSDEPLYGVIRWMGKEIHTNQVLVGVELEEEQTHLPLTLTDGTHNGRRYFKCAENRGIFVPLNQCHKDSRFSDGTPVPTYNLEKTFGKDCPIIEGAVAPLCMPTEEDVNAVCGKFRGIQGHHNSCYLDATLFSMFTFTAVFDSLLFRPKTVNDIPRYDEVQRVLREEIVNPLRTNLYVRADRVMNLRKLLDQLSSVSGLTSEEKDPEEFLNSLLAQILKAEPFLKLNSGQETYYYQLFVEKDDGLSLPTVQQLFEQSFLSSDIKLKEVPSCLIIQMPRFGKNYKMYPRILPSQLLDVTDIIEGSPRQCTVCGQLAKWECRECFGDCEEGLASTAFCDICLQKAHTHIRRSTHNPRPLSISQDYLVMAEHCLPPRLYMELFAVVCIETSHYVSFVKCGSGHEAPWCFFDSMADRKGEQNGYNIPEMVACPDISKWLSDEQLCRTLHENAPSDRYLPEHARRLLCDAYICMYQSPDVMMYQ